MILDHQGKPCTWTFESHPDEEIAEPLDATPLDPLETSGIGETTLAEHFRHSGWHRQRTKVYEALKATFQSVSRIQGFASCGSTCFILRSRTDPAELKIAASACHDRFCLPCAQGKSRVIAGNVASFLQRTQCRFVTLTLRHTQNPLATDIDRLYDGFKKLRKHPLWKNTQRGGVAFLEIKRSRDRQSWHPHLHILTTGKFINVAKLATLWKSITGDSHIVDIRAVPNIETAVNYVTKYASKPFDPSLYEEKATLEEAILALRARRMALTFGNFKGLQMTNKPSEDQWEFLDELDTLVMRACQGDNAAKAIVIAACKDRAPELFRMGMAKVVPRMNVTRPPTPNVQLYLDS